MKAYFTQYPTSGGPAGLVAVNPRLFACAEEEMDTGATFVYLAGVPAVRVQEDFEDVVDVLGRDYAEPSTETRKLLDAHNERVLARAKEGTRRAF